VSAAGLAAVIAAPHDAEAIAAWRAWRQALVVDNLTWADAQLLPLVSQARLEEWLAHDPASGRLLGIVRRAWTESQLHLRQMQEVVSRFTEGGCGPVMVAGPAALHYRNARAAGLRPIPELTLLVRRAHVGTCLRILSEDGWTPRSALPPARALSWTDHVTLTRQGMTLRLLWRPFPVVPWRAQQLEAELAPAEDAVLPPAYLLLSRLVDASGAFDPVPWRVDASLLVLTPSDWAACARLVRRYAPLALPRLTALWPKGLPRPATTASLSRAERTAHRGLVRVRAHLLKAVGRPI
jgi:hypothetical protein